MQKVILDSKSYQILSRRILNATLISALVIRLTKKKKSIGVELFLKSLRKHVQKQLRISGLFAQVRQGGDVTIKRQFSIK